MAFKKMTEFNEEKFGNFFRLVNDKDFADVVILYKSTQDVLIGNVHYVKTPDYSGYVQCIEAGCPACSDGIRIQSKLFIPMLVIAHSDLDFKGPKIQFWDRSVRFQAQLMNDVFRNYPNPSEMIFRITRHGAAGSVDTYYSIQALQTVPETYGSYEQILATNNITLPEGYDMVCKDYTAFELRTMLSAPKDGGPAASYNATPRSSYTGSAPATPDVVSTAQVEPTYVTPEFTSPEIPVTTIEDIPEVDEIEDNVDF